MKKRVLVSAGILSLLVAGYSKWPSSFESVLPKIPESVNVQDIILDARDADTEAMILLGTLYATGTEVDKDLMVAREEFSGAAFLGDDTAQYILGFMYAEGYGIPKNNQWAYVWWSIAQAHGNEDAVAALNRLSKKMNDLDIADAQRLSAEVFKEVQKNVSAYEIKRRKQEKIKEIQYREQHERLFLSKAENGDANAMWELGRTYELLKDTDEMVSWYKQASWNGHALASFSLGSYFYDWGKTPAIDLINAYQWFEVATRYKETKESANIMLDKVIEDMSWEQRLEARKRADSVPLIVCEGGASCW